jgi:hypothetical protein
MTHGTMGLLGDLCGEAEYLWKRLATVHVALERCNNAGLRRRFSFELKVHIERCQEMKVVVSKLEVLGLSQSYQFCLLKELVRRALNESYAFSI